MSIQIQTFKKKPGDICPACSGCTDRPKGGVLTSRSSTNKKTGKITFSLYCSRRPDCKYTVSPKGTQANDQAKFDTRVAAHEIPNRKELMRQYIEDMKVAFKKHRKSGHGSWKQKRLSFREWCGTKGISWKKLNRHTASPAKQRSLITN